MAPLQPQSPASSSNQALHHFTHPNHPLHKTFVAEYKCDGCNTLGSGTLHYCSGCDFGLHEFCATCPFTFPSPFHPNHQLSLVNHPGGNGRFCDLCGELVNGLFYTCRACDFDVHPLCTQLPLHVRHAFHPQHPLTLQPAQSGWCDLCRRGCKTWRYRCGACDVDIHVDCVKGPSHINGRAVPAMRVPLLPPGGYLNQHVQAGGGGGYLNQPVQGGGGGGSNSGQIYAVVGKLAAKVVLDSMLGVPSTNLF